MSKRPGDPYGWAKKRIATILEASTPLAGDAGMVSPGMLWSIKKLLALDYYLSATRPIFDKNFEELHYVDTHCGSGLIKFEEDGLPEKARFPGSPLIALLKHQEKPFSGYHVSDESEEAISALKGRLGALAKNGNPEAPVVRSFAETAGMINGMAKWGRAFVVFVDPRGYKELLWKDVEKLLSVDKADVFITFMGYAMALNLPHALKQDSQAGNFDGVFGNSEWRGCNNQDDLVSLYMRRIGTKKAYVEEIPIFRKGESKLYHLIFASGNKAGAGRVMDYTKKIMDATTTEMLTGAIKVAFGSKDLDEWMAK